MINTKKMWLAALAVASVCYGSSDGFYSVKSKIGTEVQLIQSELARISAAPLLDEADVTRINKLIESLKVKVRELQKLQGGSNKAAVEAVLKAKKKAEAALKELKAALDRVNKATRGNLELNTLEEIDNYVERLKVQAGENNSGKRKRR